VLRILTLITDGPSAGSAVCFQPLAADRDFTPVALWPDRRNDPAIDSGAADAAVAHRFTACPVRLLVLPCGGTHPSRRHEGTAAGLSNGRAFVERHGHV
jgi:hypothetical protein